MNVFNIELVKIQRQFYQEIKQNENKLMFIPQGNKEGLKFFEAMFKYQLSDEATTNDIFLFQQQPFVDSNSF